MCGFRNLSLLCCAMVLVCGHRFAAAENGSSLEDRQLLCFGKPALQLNEVSFPTRDEYIKQMRSMSDGVSGLTTAFVETGISRVQQMSAALKMMTQFKIYDDPEVSQLKNEIGDKFRSAKKKLTDLYSQVSCSVKSAELNAIFAMSKEVLGTLDKVFRGKDLSSRGELCHLCGCRWQERINVVLSILQDRPNVVETCMTKHQFNYTFYESYQRMIAITVETSALLENTCYVAYNFVPRGHDIKYGLTKSAEIGQNMLRIQYDNVIDGIKDKIVDLISASTSPAPQEEQPDSQLSVHPKLRKISLEMDDILERYYNHDNETYGAVFWINDKDDNDCNLLSSFIQRDNKTYNRNDFPGPSQASEEYSFSKVHFVIYRYGTRKSAKRNQISVLFDSNAMQSEMKLVPRDKTLPKSAYEMVSAASRFFDNELPLVATFVHTSWPKADKLVCAFSTKTLGYVQEDHKKLKMINSKGVTLHYRTYLVYGV
ncbi:hypothetical protein L596_025337 [Steinernema carpocapsae]|uniref:Uncharacterized protein n=1 Tax=Steinernema carpocapsae TaxID=34508 RepID=A0A4U5M7H7_STECR|nr:hypothetical protein L596_025337 [Steinernema carpocapsae]